VDASVLVAAVAPWHEDHVAAAAVLRRLPRIPAHAAWETYSVLTRLPVPHRLEADEVAAWLRRALRAAPLTRPADAPASVLERCAEAGIVGGQVYDARIGATAAAAGAKLLTRDRRASASYAAVGAEWEIVS
jgi:predicted nucleic acid-binding protein